MKLDNYEYWDKPELVARLKETQDLLKIARHELEWIAIYNDELMPATRKLFKAIVEAELPERDTFGRLVESNGEKE